MTGLQMALLSGLLLGVGLVILIRQITPYQVDAADFTHRTSPRRRATSEPIADLVDARDRIGAWAIRLAPSTVWHQTPAADLDLLGIPVHRHYGRKITYATLGLIFPPILSYILVVGGSHIPLAVPGFASLAFGGFLFVLPDLDVRADAKAARTEMVHALTAYIDLIALQRKGAAGPRQAMTQAASIAHGWVFRRIAQELRRSQLEGRPPWDALRDLSRRIAVPQLDDIANILALSERSGAQVYDALRARAASMRNEILNAELSKANATSERMTIPTAATAMVFMVIIGTPAIWAFF
jgi:Flp pilus assembly protein TadB